MTATSTTAHEGGETQLERDIAERSAKAEAMVRTRLAIAIAKAGKRKPEGDFDADGYWFPSVLENVEGRVFTRAGAGKNQMAWRTGAATTKWAGIAHCRALVAAYFEGREVPADVAKLCAERHEYYRESEVRKSIDTAIADENKRRRQAFMTEAQARYEAEQAEKGPVRSLAGWQARGGARAQSGAGAENRRGAKELREIRGKHADENLAGESLHWGVESEAQVNPARIKTASVDVCAVCSWRGLPGDWTGHERSWAHRIAVARADARKCGLTPLFNNEVDAHTTGVVSSAIYKALGPAVVLVPMRHSAFGGKPELTIHEPFVQQAVKAAVDTWYELPASTKRRFRLVEYLREVFPDGAPVNFEIPML